MLLAKYETNSEPVDLLDFSQDASYNLLAFCALFALQRIYL
jgi:hypothetical protein